jgi:hypothetical protein
MSEDNKSRLSLFFVIFINFLFISKYAYRYTDLFWLLAFSVTTVQYLLIIKSNIILHYFEKIKLKSIYLIFSFLLFFIFIAYKIPLDTLKIDRWSVIDSFWNNYFNGLYVYEAKSFDNNYPGPMPFYFLLMLPFYFINEYSFITSIGVLILFYIFKFLKISKINLFNYSLIICSSFFIIYEILSRSNIFFNGVLVVFSLLVLFIKKLNLKYVIVKGVLIGLCLSTRNVFVIPFALGLLFLLIQEKQNFVKLFSIGLISIFTFCMTFVPFIYNYFDKFLVINPFIIQSSFLMPTEISFTCILLSLSCIYLIKNKLDVFFFTGLSLFVTILVYHLYIYSIRGFHATFFESHADITYFILCIPFFIFYYISSNITLDFHPKNPSKSLI